MNLFKLDSHMHLDLYANRNTIIDYIEAEKSYTIAVTNLPDLYERVYSCIGENTKYIRCALGFHPELAFQYRHQIIKFSSYLASTRYIGEIGLDFTIRDNNNRIAQEDIFSHIIYECNKAKEKILTIHSRRAEKEVINILNNLSTCSVIMHWYSGSLALLNEGLDRGYYYSVNHQMLQSVHGRKIVDSIPNDRILFESDAPFTNGLSKKYTNNFMKDLYNYLCNSRRLSESDLSIQLYNNFKTLLTNKK